MKYWAGELNRLRSHECGMTATEYALILAFVVLVAAGAVTILGVGIRHFLGMSRMAIRAASSPDG